MTDSQAEWLRKLRDDGPQRPIKHEWMQMRRSRSIGFIVWGPGGNPPQLHLGEVTAEGWLARITPEGLAALAEHEASKWLKENGHG